LNFTLISNTTVLDPKNSYKEIIDLLNTRLNSYTLPEDLENARLYENAETTSNLIIIIKR